jgi:hypothetical protein
MPMGAVADNNPQPPPVNPESGLVVFYPFNGIAP